MGYRAGQYGNINCRMAYIKNDKTVVGSIATGAD